MQTMMSYQLTPRSNRPKVFMIKNVLQFALFVVFSLWLLYQIRQPNNNGGPERQLSSERISNFLGRKGSAGLLKSTHSGLTLEDVTNPGEEGEITRYSKDVDEVEFRLKMGNDSTTLLPTNGKLTMAKSNISFPDENGIPQHVRDKFIGNQSDNETRVKGQSLITTRAGNKSNGTLVKA